MDAHRANVSRLVAEWQQPDDVLPPPNPEAVRALEERLHVRLPDDLHVWFELTGGMGPSGIDDAHIRWWPLAEIVPLSQRASRPEARGFYVVADVLIEASLISVQLEDGRRWPRGTVIEGELETWIVRAPSWAAYIERRLRDPDGITNWPDGPWEDALR